jgi:hypothetical protein
MLPLISENKQLYLAFVICGKFSIDNSFAFSAEDKTNALIQPSSKTSKGTKQIAIFSLSLNVCSIVQ